MSPIEKKPFFHVLPASFSFSIATVGCNLECKFCQNREISQAHPEDVYSYEAPPEMVVAKAKEVGARSVAYTYTDLCKVGADTPLHFSRFYPLYKLKSLPPTPVSTLEKARAAALDAGIQYVYIGNVPGHEGENTFCARCKKMIIQRRGYMVAQVNMRGGKCTYCGNPIPGIWA